VSVMLMLSVVVVGHISVLPLVGLGVCIVGGLFAPSVVKVYHSLVHWHPSLEFTYHVYSVVAASPVMLHVLVPLFSLFPLSLPMFGLVSIVQFILSIVPSGSVITIDTWLVASPTPVVPLFGVSVFIVWLSLAVKVYHSRVQSVPSLALMYHV